MADNLGVNPNPVDPSNKPELARDIAYRHIKSRLEKTDTHVTFSKDEVYVVWFAFTLGSWKALISTSLPDGRYYEVTCKNVGGSDNANPVFIDTYVKIDNTEYEDR